MSKIKIAWILFKLKMLWLLLKATYLITAATKLFVWLANKTNERDARLTTYIGQQISKIPDPSEYQERKNVAT